MRIAPFQFFAVTLPLKSKIRDFDATDIVERAPDVINCAMLLFIENIDGAIENAQSVGGGGSDNDLKWGRDPDEDDRHFAFRCMQQAHRLLKPAPSRTARRGR